MQTNVAVALGYPIGLVSIIVLCTEKKDRFVKFHALQALLLHVGAGLLFGAIAAILSIVYLALVPAGEPSGGGGANAVGVLLVVFWSLFPFLFFAAVVVAAVKAYGGAEFKMPVIGKLASKLADRWGG